MSIVLLLKNWLSVYNEKPKVGFRTVDELHFVLIITTYHSALAKETYMKNTVSSQAMPTGKTKSGS